MRVQSTTKKFICGILTLTLLLSLTVTPVNHKDGNKIIQPRINVMLGRSTVIH